MKDEFGKYYEAVEPGRRERAYAWATAIGLQDVDGLKVSSFLAKTAIRNIEGEITQDQARQIIDEHYAMIARNDKKPRYSGYEYLDPVTGEKLNLLMCMKRNAELRKPRPWKSLSGAGVVRTASGILKGLRIRV